MASCCCTSFGETSGSDDRIRSAGGSPHAKVGSVKNWCCPRLRRTAALGLRQRFNAPRSTHGDPNGYRPISPPRWEGGLALPHSHRISSPLRVEHAPRTSGSSGANAFVAAAVLRFSSGFCRFGSGRCRRAQERRLQLINRTVVTPVGQHGGGGRKGPEQGNGENEEQRRGHGGQKRSGNRMRGVRSSPAINSKPHSDAQMSRFAPSQAVIVLLCFSSTQKDLREVRIFYSCSPVDG